ncbi:MAG: hypothetical protein ACSLFQ_16775 [Thermoanaerobaculia bacterium]
MKQNRATVVKTMKPGDPGTRRQLERYGEELLFVRYRYDQARHERLTTVEIVVDRGPRAVPVAPYQHVGLRLRYEETDLRNGVREAGGQWDARRKLWWLPWAAVLRLGLAARVAAWTDSGTG